ncbi:MAG: transcriptional regulator NrdR [Planctomycetota bacterium]
MRCPFCRADDDRVIDTRLTDDGTAIRRRRECNNCHQRFTTYERVEAEEHLRVIKRDGAIQLFDRRKLLKGILIACEKRPVPSEALEGLVNQLHHALLAEGRREVSSEEIGERVMRSLRDLDDIAYVRFASVYRKFKDVDDFMNELRRIIGEGHGADQRPAS